MKILLDCDADVNIQGDIYYNALKSSEPSKHSPFQDDSDRFSCHAFRFNSKNRKISVSVFGNHFSNPRLSPMGAPDCEVSPKCGRSLCLSISCNGTNIRFHIIGTPRYVRHRLSNNVRGDSRRGSPKLNLREPFSLLAMRYDGNRHMPGTQALNRYEPRHPEPICTLGALTSQDSFKKTKHVHTSGRRSHRHFGRICRVLSK